MRLRYRLDVLVFACRLVLGAWSLVLGLVLYGLVLLCLGCFVVVIVFIV